MKCVLSMRTFATYILEVLTHPVSRNSEKISSNQDTSFWRFFHWSMAKFHREIAKFRTIFTETMNINDWNKYFINGIDPGTAGN